jgi:hypothetical protein
MLARAASVEEDEGAGRLRRSRPCEMRQRALQLALLLLAGGLGWELLPLGGGHLADDQVTAVDLLLHFLELGLALLILTFLGRLHAYIVPGAADDHAEFSTNWRKDCLTPG